MSVQGRMFIQRALSSKPCIWYHVSNSSRVICSCYANKCHRHSHRNCIYNRWQSQLLITRFLRLVKLGQAYGLQSLAGLVRSFSLPAGADDNPSASEQVDIDSFDDVKELDAVELGPRKAVKNRQSAGVSKDFMRSVGKLVPDKIVTLLDQDGAMLGSVHRTEAIKRSQESSLKLVLINPNSHPYPTYRLMTGQQLHQEQMHLNEKLKTKSAPTQIKEVKMSSGIGKHDLEVKKRHMQDWFQDDGAHTHVRVTIMGKDKKQKTVNKAQQMAIIQHLMSGLEDKITFSSKPKDTGKDGESLMVVLRPMSAKEKAMYVKQRNKEESLKQQNNMGEKE